MEALQISPEQQFRARKLSRSFYHLFLLVIPTVIAELMTGRTAQARFPGLLFPGAVIAMLTQLCYSGILLQMRLSDVRYRTAGLCLTISAAATFLTEALGMLHPSPYLVFPAIAGVVLDLVGIYCEYHAHSAVLADFCPAFAHSWHRLWYWFIGIYSAMVLSIGLMTAHPVFGAVAFSVTALAAAVVVILKFVFLRRTARMLQQI